MKVYQAISQLMIAVANCKRSGNTEWEGTHNDRLDRICELAPSGSGIDQGVKLYNDSTPDRLIFSCSFHHIDDGGSYDGWTGHKAIVTPSLAFGLEIRITGRDRNGIKDHLHEVMHAWLTSDICRYCYRPTVNGRCQNTEAGCAGVTEIVR